MMRSLLLWLTSKIEAPRVIYDRDGGSIAIILAGGYLEEYRVGDRVKTRVFTPWSINVIRADDYHRVDLIGSDSWSLFIAGPKAGSWFFWCRDRKARAPWRPFLAWKQDGLGDPQWEPDTREGKL